MSRNLKALIAIPTYNHGATIHGVVKGVLSQISARRPAAGDVELARTVLVVDDGSEIPVAGRLAGLPNVQVLRHEKNQGKGAAILTALDEAAKIGASHLITLDADAQHNPEDIPKFLAAIKDAPTALLVGERDFTAANVPGSSKFGRWFSNFWLRVHTGCKLGDSQSGFRAYPVDFIRMLTLRERRYAFEVEVLVESAWAGLPLGDVPIEVFYPKREERVSHFKAFADNARISLLNTRLTMRCLVPWPHKTLVEKPENGEGGKAANVSVIRPLQSIRMLLKTGVPPKEVGMSAALGVLVGALPLFGVQTVTVLALAGYLRLNKLAALAANQLCMPPIAPALAIEIGYFIRHGRFLTEVSLEVLGKQAHLRLFEWLLGGLLLGPALAVIVGLSAYFLAMGVNHNLRALANHNPKDHDARK